MKLGFATRLCITSLVLITSCSDQVAQQRSVARQQAVAADLDAVAKWESERPPAVAADIREIGVMTREYDAKLHSDIGWYDFMFQKEVQHWNERQGDRTRAVLKEFAGDPKAAHDTAVQFLD